MVAKVRKALEVLREAWLLSRVPRNETIFRELGIHAEERLGKSGRKGLRQYLVDYPAIGRLEVVEDWTYDHPRKEMRLRYSNSLFALGCLRVKGEWNEKGVIVFLPGYQAGAEDVLGSCNHRQNMTGVAGELGMAIACWDWPLQGDRLDGCLYQGFECVYSGEREYSRNCLLL